MLFYGRGRDQPADHGLCSIFNALFADGSHEERQLAHDTRHTLLITFAILVPAVVLALVVAPYVLLLFGRSHSSEGARLLRILAVVSLPLALNSIYISIKRVKTEIKMIVVLTALERRPRLV